MDRSKSNRGLLEATYCKTAPIPADDAGHAPDAIAERSFDLSHVLSGYAFAKEEPLSPP